MTRKNILSVNPKRACGSESQVIER